MKQLLKHYENVIFPSSSCNFEVLTFVLDHSYQGVKKIMLFNKFKGNGGFLSFLSTILFMAALLVASIAGPVMIGEDNTPLIEWESVERF